MGWISNFEWVKSKWVCSVGRVKIDDILHAATRYEAHIVDGKVAVRIDNSVALAVEDVTKCE
ncbi:hypothetical protein D9M69_614790 [compost metagenome]